MNALDVETLGKLRDRLTELRKDEAVRVIVLTGAGDKAFAAGADIKYMSGLSVEQAKEWGALGHQVGQLLEIAPKVSLAAINGFALGGGCELALACDMRYAASTAKLGQPEVNLGIFPGWGGTQRLARVCGLGVAKDLILTGRVVDAKEARRIGLVNDVFEPAELMETTLKIASDRVEARSRWRRRRPRSTTRCRATTSRASRPRPRGSASSSPARTLERA
jgi:enoyl-CoA hydratase